MYITFTRRAGTPFGRFTDGQAQNFRTSSLIFRRVRIRRREAFRANRLLTRQEAGRSIGGTSRLARRRSERPLVVGRLKGNPTAVRKDAQTEKRECRLLFGILAKRVS